MLAHDSKMPRKDGYCRNRGQVKEYNKSEQAQLNLLSEAKRFLRSFFQKKTDL